MARKYLSAMLKDILEAARERNWKSGRRAKGRKGREVAEFDFEEGINGPWYTATETGDVHVGK